MKSPCDTALVHPRRKAGQAKLGKSARAVLLTRSDIEKLMPYLRLSEAAKQLGLSATTVKKVCRKLGIRHWNTTSFREDCDDGRNDVSAPLPVADVMHIDQVTSPMKLESDSTPTASQSFFDNGRAFTWPPHSHTSEQASCMSSGSVVASGSGLDFSYTTSTAAAQQRASVATPAFSRSASASSSTDSGWSESTDGGEGRSGAVRQDAAPSCMPDAVSSDVECTPVDDDFVNIARCNPALSLYPVAHPKP